MPIARADGGGTSVSQFAPRAAHRPTAADRATRRLRGGRSHIIMRRRRRPRRQRQQPQRVARFDRRGSPRYASIAGADEAFAALSHHAARAIVAHSSSAVSRFAHVARPATARADRSAAPTTPRATAPTRRLTRIARRCCRGPPTRSSPGARHAMVTSSSTIVSPRRLNTGRASATQSHARFPTAETSRCRATRARRSRRAPPTSARRYRDSHSTCRSTPRTPLPRGVESGSTPRATPRSACAPPSAAARRARSQPRAPAAQRRSAGPRRAAPRA